MKRLRLHPNLLVIATLLLLPACATQRPVAHTPLPQTPVAQTPVAHTPLPQTPVAHTPLPAASPAAGKPRLTEQQVIQIATEALERKGRQLDNFKEGKAFYEPGQQKGEWFVVFEFKIPTPDADLFVRVNDETAEARTWP